MLLYVIVGILFFGVLIAVHEGGHFLAAKLLDVQVNEFAIGMGPAFFTRTKGETQYSLRLFPIGGYCAMEGENGEDIEDEETGEVRKNDNPRAFSNKAPWRRFIILVAGSAANLVAGFVLVAILFTAVGGYTVPVVKDFMDGFPCEGEEGLLPGDRLLSINGHKIRLYSDVQGALADNNRETMDFVIRRNGETLVRSDLPVTLREYEGQTVKMYGFYFAVEKASFPGVLAQSWHTCGYFARSVWTGLAMLVRGEVGLNDMSGPVGIVSYLGEAGTQGGSVRGGLYNVCYIIGLVAVNLAIMNLLPIPALDGGRIFFLIVTELFFLLTGRQIDPKYEAYLHGLGFLLLILLMVAVTFSDILKLVN